LGFLRIEAPDLLPPIQTGSHHDPDVKALVDGLRRAGLAEVDTSNLGRLLYACDASLYRVVPAAVVRPRDVDEVLATLAVCADVGQPVTARGAGTSVAGNAVGTGVVLDMSRHLRKIIEIDTERRTATIQPGVVAAALQPVAGSGLRFGPDPSTHDRCTIGGMIGNNACGSRALAYGRTVDNVLALDVMTGSGERLTLRSGAVPPPGSATIAALRAVVSSGLGVIRTEFGRFGRQNSGYSLEHLLPERRFDVCRALVGSEGTLGVVLGATVRLVEEPRHRALVVLGYPDMADAADAVAGFLQYHPTACEGLDARIVDVVRREHGSDSVPPLPRGAGWLLVEVGGDTEAQVRSDAEGICRHSGSLEHQTVFTPETMARWWRIRSDGAGLAGRAVDGRPAHAGWEDAAVPPDRLGAYLRDFDALLVQHGLAGVPYGHFADGCIHVRIDFPLIGPTGHRVMRGFLEDAASLVVSHGGSLSGEHGDGRARSRLLDKMYSPTAMRLFSQVKAVFDPHNRLNPGVVVGSRPLDADLRTDGQRAVRAGLGFGFRRDSGDLGAAVHRCTGVGKCLADSTQSGGVMCPSYVATREELHSTRGRARMLQEMVSGSFESGWRAPEVHHALDLCLACKACASECPTGIDVASYKAEVLHQSYRRRVRPRAHYALGWLPRWARLASHSPAVANLGVTAPGLRALTRWAAGIDQRRSLPRFAGRTFQAWARTRPSPASSGARSGRDVVVWADTFTNHLDPEIGIAAVAVLEAAGYRVRIPAKRLCCGLTWITTGQLGAARRILGRTISGLLEYARAGIPVVGLEPSCTAVLCSDSLELAADREAAVHVAAGVQTLAEMLGSTSEWSPPDLSGVHVVAQPHCHQSAVLSWDPDAGLLAAAGAHVQRVGGCCGLAGNFGLERGHYDVSVAIAEHALLPAIRSAGPDAVVLADGLSCRTQIADLSSAYAVHLAQLLAKSGPG
jgi:FAD/FMN-containing dehydrogenase/Fe-S oxidoreductase